MFNHVHGHSHISGFLRNYMCKTIFLAGKTQRVVSFVRWEKSPLDRLQVVKPCSPSNTKRFRTTTPKPEFKTDSTKIQQFFQYKHPDFSRLRRIFWMFGCCRRVTAQSGERWHTLSQRWKASFHAQGLGIANVHFPMLKMNRNESQYGSPIVSRFLQIDSQSAVYWFRFMHMCWWTCLLGLGKVDSVVLQNLCLHHTHVGSHFGEGYGDFCLSYHILVDFL